ncbi:MAG: nucleotidyltransferase domain-containing protein [Gallionellales bacterium CG03_land_8_20_14_0_80_55_15]|nr:MAG: nucleotidyltransferase domain-containing protein [Gallionellales bacterium CG03_land_8_20_14_0_80_55_15]
MRISNTQAEQAVSIIRDALGSDAAVWLFGSRTDDSKRGGDVDLYAETSLNGVLLDETVRAKIALNDLFGRSVDLVVNNHRKSRPI